ncbi:MAG: helix-turn-helix domain-containing protein, partial [Thermoanaerobaculia bacterium]
LEKERGHVSRAAESLGISRSALYQKIRKYGIDVSRN